MAVSAPEPHRIVIVGGGAAGLPLAVRLGDAFGRRGRATVTLIDRFASHLWKPLLHEVAAGRMDADVHGIDYVLMAYWHHFRFRQGTVIGLDRTRRVLKLDRVLDEEGAEILPQRDIPYDTLIFCVGSVSNDYGTPGVMEHAISLDTAQDAERFHRRLLAACVRADERAEHGHSSAVDIVIIGAGATGVELAAEIRHCTKAHASYGLENLHPERDIHLTLLEAAPRILPPLSDSIAEAATDLLQKLDVSVRTGERVTSIDDVGVRTASGSLLSADLVVWAAGIQAPAWLAELDGLEVNRAHQLVIDTTLVTSRDPNIFALGDCAACPWPESGKAGAILPPRAQVARQQASLLVKSIRARLAGQP
ncbi:MAG TPA: NAD(P)/FAD-dependent oxidoreductase, partial [Caldimonas sp.]|nr:NAD(P)/FAD-dependent oxidoreductase [Caldimonas sp.]